MTIKTFDEFLEEMIGKPIWVIRHKSTGQLHSQYNDADEAHIAHNKMGAHKTDYKVEKKSAKKSGNWTKE